MAETAAQQADGVLPELTLRPWVLSPPHASRFALAIDPDALKLLQQFGFIPEPKPALSHAVLGCAVSKPASREMSMRNES